MKEVEDSVSRESGRSQPEALLEAYHRQCQEPESGVKIAFLDLDRFQSVNPAQDVISQIL